MATVICDIDVDDFLDECNSREINNVIKWLVDNNKIEPPMIPRESYGIRSRSFDESVYKIYGNGHLFTVEEEDFIIKLANKVP